MSKRRSRKQRDLLRRIGLGIYRAAVVVSAIIVATYGAYSIFIGPPEQKQTPPPDESGGGSSLSDVSQPADQSQVPAGPVRKDDFWTFLLIGTDDGNGNADTIMVASYDVANQKVGVVSIPRDTIVDRSWSKYPKINGAYGGGGVDLVREEVSDLLGIPIDYYIKVDINAFVAIVDEVGGVDFEVPVDMNYDDPWQDLSIHFKKGMQHLTGQEALEVVRFRHNNDMSGYSDIGRTQTQQKLLTAVAKKVLSWNNIPRITSFINIFAEYVKTDLSVTDMIYFATQALYLNTDTGVTTKTLEGRGDAKYNGYTWCYELDLETTLNDINTLLNPYTTPVTAEMANIVQTGS